MSDDLTERLREWWDYDHGRLIEQALDRIEDLEAELRKAVGALGDISNGEPEWPDDPQKELDWCRNRATTALAELKGETDE